MRRAVIAACVVLWAIVCLDRVLLGRHFPTDVIAGTMLGVGMVLIWMVVIDPWPRAHAEKSEPLPEVGPVSRRLAVVLNPIKVEDVGQFESTVDAMAQESGWGRPTLALHDRRGPRHRHGRGGLGRRRRPGARLRRRRHGPRGVRGARRHRDPGRDHPGGHRQPAGAQPRRTPLPALGHRRRPQRAGPGHRPGRGVGRRLRGHPLHGDGRHGLRRRDHGGRQRGHQEEDRLVRLRHLRRPSR